MKKEGKILVPVAVSNRHIHLTDVDVDKLFGKSYKLSVRNNLSQTGQFAANETVAVTGSKGNFQKVRIVGPTRAYTQLEISKTDSHTLGVVAPLSYAGQAKDPATVTLVGPKGKIKRACAIIAVRHLHISTDDATKFRLKNKDSVSIKINGERSTIFENVVVRVDSSFVTEVHLDTDEGNAAGVTSGTNGEIIK